MTPLAAYLLLFVAVGIGFIFVHLMAGKFIRPNKPNPSKRTIYECGEPTIGSAWIQFDLRFYVVALLFVIFDVEVAFFFPWAVVFGKANALAAVGPPTKAEVFKETGERAWELMPAANRTTFAVQHAQMMEFTSADLARLNELRSPMNELRSRMNELRSRMNEKNQSTMTDVDRKELAELAKEYAELGKKLVELEVRKEYADLDFREKTMLQTQRQARLLAWVALVEIIVFFGVLLVGFAYLWHRGDLAWVRSLAAERPAGELVPIATGATTIIQKEPATGAVAHS